MAEACGACSRSFLPNRKINESLKCACKRSFFSQIVTCGNVPSDQDCWIEVPKRFVRHYSSQFGKTVSFEGDDGRSYPCRLVGSKMAEVGYGFEWYEFASAHNVSLEDQVVLTLMENSRFLVQVYKGAHRKVKVEPVEQDVDVQVAGAQEWLRAKARRSVTNTDTDSAPWVADSMPGSEGPLNEEHQVPMGQKKKPTARMSFTSNPPQPQVPDDCLYSDAETESDGETSSSSTSDSDWSLYHKVLDNKKGSELEKDALENDSESTSSTSTDNMTEEEELRSSSRIRRSVLAASGDEDTRSPLLYVAPRVTVNHQFSEPGTTVKRTYASKRRPVTCADRDKAFEAAKACPVTHSSFLRTLEKATCYRALSVVIPAPWFRENMPETDRAYDATIVNDEGKSWKVRIRGIEIFWGIFSLDHNLEEGDVVVMELANPRLESLEFLVHIFRVVDVKVTVTGKEGWAMHYNVVEGRNKRKKHEARSKGKGRVKRKHAHGESSGPAETSHRRLTRRQAVVEDTEEEEVSDKDPVVSELMEVKMEYARESTDGGPKTTKVMSRNVKVEN